MSLGCNENSYILCRILKSACSPGVFEYASIDMHVNMLSVYSGCNAMQAVFDVNSSG